MTALWCLSILLEILTLARLCQLSLHRKSPFNAFATMQCFMLLRDLLLICLPVQSIRYTYAWEFSLPLILASHAWAGVSCYRAIASLYSGSGRFAAYLFGIALGISAAFSLAALPFELSRWDSEPVFRSFLVCYRWTDTLMAGGLLLALAFISRFPSPLRRLPGNLYRHTALLACYFSVYAICYFLPVSLEQWMEPARMLFVCLLYGLWPLLLTAKGEHSEAWPQLDAQTKRFLDRREAAARAFFVGDR